MEHFLVCFCICEDYLVDHGKEEKVLLLSMFGGNGVIRSVGEWLHEEAIIIPFHHTVFTACTRVGLRAQ